MEIVPRSRKQGDEFSSVQEKDVVDWSRLARTAGLMLVINLGWWALVFAILNLLSG